LNARAGLSPQALDAAMEVFLAAGFHAATVEDLERATGRPWESLVTLYGDKEGLFFAATEARLQALTAGNAPDAAVSLEAISGMLRGLKATGSSTRLRVVHKAALQRLLALAEASS
jgi:AcrR family transcriptional regulator